jgi:hypothetical protein
MTTTNFNDMLLGFAKNGGDAGRESGWTAIQDANLQFLLAQYKIMSSATTYSVSDLAGGFVIADAIMQGT